MVWRIAGHALATGPQAASKNGRICLQSDTERRPKKEGGGGDRAATNGGLVTNTDRRRSRCEAWLDSPS